MKSVFLFLTVFIGAVVSSSFDAVDSGVLRQEYEKQRQQPSLFDFHKQSFWTFIDLLQGKHYISPSRESSYKAKHEMGRPQVGSIFTAFKNNWILAVSIGVTYTCYLTAILPLVFSNDAGAFFTDCMTMWTMYVFFFQDPDAINYSY